MANIKVLLVDQLGSVFDVSYIQEIPMSLNFAIADVRNPDKRNSTFSKTITFPATKEVNRFFRSSYNINVDLLDFDPNLKCGIYYYIDNVEQLRGDLQLLKINVDGDGAPLTYETSAVGRLGNLFLSIGDGYLTDLNFSAYDHVLSKANVKASWLAAVGSGYLYGLINYGINQVNTESEYHVKHMRPQIYKKEILDKIFSAAGKTYTSTYFNSNYFKRQVIPTSNETILLSQTDIDNSQFYAGRTTNQTGTSAPATYGLGVWQPASGLTTVLFNNDSTAGFNDAGGQYNTATGEFTVGTTNIYNLSAIINYDLTFTNSLGTATNATISVGDIDVLIKKKVGASWVIQTLNADYTLIPITMPTLTTSGHQVSVTWPNQTFTAGDMYRIDVVINSLQFNLFTAGAVNISTGTTTAFITIKPTSTFYCSLVSTVIQEGYTIQLNQALPENVKKVDWLMSEFKAANLYMDIDKDDDNNYIIEPREADVTSGSPGFYSGQTVDWSSLFDAKLDHEVIPMGELDFKRREYYYKSDIDDFNDRYFKNYKEVYGFKFVDINNDFIKGTNKTELIYSPTPLVGNDINGLVVPYIRKNDNGTFTSLKSNIRSLYFGGMIALSYGNWTLKSASGDEVLTSWPFVGDCDNPYNPTLSFNWDTPHKMYYSFPTATYTSNDLYNRYYSRYNNQVTDPNSKIVRAYFTLSKSDIQDFDFRKTVWVGKPLDAFFYVNAIPDYDVLNPKSTLVELLKLQEHSVYVPASIALPQQEATFQNRVINGNYSNGSNNTNLGNNSHIVGGSGNYIAPGAENIQLRNCVNVVVPGNVSNFTADGISNRVITSIESNSVTKQNSPSVTLDATTNNTIDASYNGKVVRIDGSAGGFTITGDDANMTDCDITFKRIDGTGAVIQLTDLDATKTVDGVVVPYTFSAVQWSNKKFTWTGAGILITG